MADTKKKENSLEKWLTDLAASYVNGVDYLNTSLEKAGFGSFGHAIAHRHQSAPWIIEFFASCNVSWDEAEYKTASIDTIKHELELAIRAYKTPAEKLELIHEINRNLSDIKDIDEIHIPTHHISERAFRIELLQMTG